MTDVEHEPFKRTMSAVEALGLQTSSEWDDANFMATAFDMHVSKVSGELGQQKIDTKCNTINRAKQVPYSSPYTKVLCKFNTGESEVPTSYMLYMIQKKYTISGVLATMTGCASLRTLGVC
jgi:hypothetical protein